MKIKMGWWSGALRKLSYLNEISLFLSRKPFLSSHLTLPPLLLSPSSLCFKKEKHIAPPGEGVLVVVSRDFWGPPHPIFEIGRFEKEGGGGFEGETHTHGPFFVYHFG